MGSVVGGAIGFVVGLVLAGVTAYGVVQSQQDSDPAPVSSTTTVEYGSNG